MSRDFKGVWIPREVYLNKKLTYIEKILYVEISSLDNENGCFASNKYLAEFIGVSITSINNKGDRTEPEEVGSGHVTY